MRAAPSQKTLEELEQQLLADPLNEGPVQAYFDCAQSNGKLARARRTFSALMHHRPFDRRLHSLYIALCLTAGDHAAAMDTIQTLMAAACPPEDALLDAALAVRSRLSPRNVASARHPRLSLCMIARDEALNLSRCLHYNKPLVDEIVVVDTGSRDRTKDIAKVFGARVFDFPWRDDFAAARNFALDQACGEWILVLDADEIVAGEDFKSLRVLLDQAGQLQTVAAYAMDTRNYTHTANAVGWQPNDDRYAAHEAGMGWFPSTKVRLFKRDKSIRFHFAVHERVEPSLKAAGMISAPCAIPVHHYGYLDETRNQQKALAYYQLGYAKLDQMANDLPALRELAVQAGQLERWQEAIELWQRLLCICPEYPEALVNLASAYWNRGQYALSLQWAQKAACQSPQMKEARYNVGVSHLLMGQARQAKEVLSSLVDQYPDYLAARFMLAASCGCQGQGQTAGDHLRRLQSTPAGPALALAVQDLVQRLCRAGRSLEAARLIKAAGLVLDLSKFNGSD